MKQIRLAVTALTGSVIAGHANSKGTEITEGSRQDVTSDFMKSLIDKAQHHGGEFDIVCGNEKWVVSVKKDKP